MRQSSCVDELDENQRKLTKSIASDKITCLNKDGIMACLGNGSSGQKKEVGGTSIYLRNRAGRTRRM